MTINKTIPTHMANDIQPMNEGGIVLYQPDENIKLEVKLDANRETVWLTQQQKSKRKK